jgi:hypothetical protein
MPTLLAVDDEPSILRNIASGFAAAAGSGSPDPWAARYKTHGTSAAPAGVPVPHAPPGGACVPGSVSHPLHLNDP